jgi:hypothetical protein
MPLTYVLQLLPVHFELHTLMDQQAGRVVTIIVGEIDSHQQDKVRVLSPAYA